MIHGRSEEGVNHSQLRRLREKEEEVKGGEGGRGGIGWEDKRRRKK